MSERRINRRASYSYLPTPQSALRGLAGAAQGWNLARRQQQWSNRMSSMMGDTFSGASSFGGGRRYGGSGSYHVGKFGSTKPASRGSGSRILRSGMGYEQTTAGTVSSPVDNVIYFGHSTWPAYQLVKAVCAAILRRAYQKLGVDLNRTNSVLPTHALATEMSFAYLGTNQDFREERIVGGITFGTTTVDQAAVEMARTIFRTMYFYFDGAAGGDARAPVKWQAFTLYNPTSTPVSAGVILPLGDMLIEVQVSSMLKVQNISFLGSTSSDPDADTTDNVNNITLEGYHYKGYGNHMLMKGGFIDGPAGYRTYNNDAAITTDRISGVMRKNPSATRATGVNMDQLPVKPFQWQNVSRGAPVRLDSGCAKTDFINQYKRMTFQKFLDTLLAAGSNTIGTTNTAESGVAAENWSNQGKFSSFGLSRLINHTGPAPQSLSCIYECEQRIYANVVKVFRTPAVANTVVITGADISQT